MIHPCMIWLEQCHRKLHQLGGMVESLQTRGYYHAAPERYCAIFVYILDLEVIKMDENKTNIMPIMEDTYGKKDAVKWFVFWRIFFMACAELWGYNNGNDWLVSQYLFSKQLPN